MTANTHPGKMCLACENVAQGVRMDDSTLAHIRVPRSGSGAGPRGARDTRLKRNRHVIHDIADTLDAIDRGETLAASALLPLVYDELRALAARKLAQEKPGQTLDPTALVHEAYLRLVGNERDSSAPGAEVGWANRRHFFGAAAEAMRRILVESARRKGREKHGGGRVREQADLDGISANGDSQDILALHEALEKYAVREPLKAKLVELRFFGGLTLEQAACCLEISLSTADRAWKYSRAWLYAAMADADPEEK